MSKIFLFFIALAIFVAAGCTTVITPDATAPKELSIEEREASKKVGFQFGEELIAALQAKDYKKFISNFTPETKKEISEQAFQGFAAGFGEITNMGYLTTLESPFFETYVWKLKIERKIPQSDSKEVQIVTDEALLRMTIANDNLRYYIISWHIK